MATTTSHQISKDLYLVRQQLGGGQKAPTVKVDPPVNHIAVLDCSGSMHFELPQIREQLKKRIPKLLKKDDTLSLIWFSGRGQFGTLLEAEAVASLPELQEVNNAIDRYLKPVGLTGFKEPLEEAKKLIERVSKKNKNPFALIFCSDGYDNQWDRQQILKAVEDTAAGLSSAAFIEYGNYADRQLLTKMAEKAGGTLLHGENFDKYQPIFESAISKTVTGSPRVEVKVEGDVIGGFTFSMSKDKELISYEVDSGKIGVPEDLSEIFFLSPTSVGAQGQDLQSISATSKAQNQTDVALSAAYAATSLFSLRMQPNIVLPLLKSLGDVRFIKQFGGCFAKQAYSAFMDATREASFDVTARCTAGWDPTQVPPDDAFTALDFLRVLNSEESNRVLLDNKDFKYTRIGRPAVPVVEKDKDGNDIPALDFKKKDSDEGYPVSTLTYNETRPNVSILLRKEGTVDLSKRLKGSGFEKKIPKDFKTFVFRNYTIIRDGIINVERLPVRMTGGTVRKLVEAGFPMEAVQGLDGEDQAKAVLRVKKASNDRPVSFVVDLKSLPVINRNMVKDTSAKVLFEKQWELTKARATQKVLNDVKKEKFPRESEGFKVLYGEDGAEWLKAQAITDYSGFGPKTVQGEASDQYVGKELKVALKGLSSLPTVKEAREKIASGKPTIRHELLRPALNSLQAFEDSDVLKTAKNKDKVFEAWLDDQATDAKNKVRDLLYEVSQIRFGVIVGQVWPTEFKSLDEGTLEITVDSQKLTGIMELKELQIDI